MSETTKSGGTRKSAAAKKTKPEVRLLTVNEIEEIDDLPTKIVEIPEWGEGVGVKIRALTKKQHTDVKERATVRGQIDEDLATIFGIIESVVEPKFTYDQVAILQQKSAAAIDRIEAAMLELNGLTAEALAALEAAFRAVGG